MSLIEYDIEVPVGGGYFLHQDEKSNAYIYSTKDGLVNLNVADTKLGTWDLQYSPTEMSTFEKDVNYITGDSVEDTQVFLFKKAHGMSICVLPVSKNAYKYDNIYRLYWGYDSRKLYMNICDSWEMIGTLRHELMENIGTLSHDEIEAKLNQIEETLGAISSAVSTLNGMNGDVTLAQGDNVTITKDAATKKLTVTSKDTVTTVNSLQGAVILEAGDNVAISQPTGTNKLVIAAAGATGAAPTTSILTVNDWTSSSRAPKLVGGAYMFGKDVEITSIGLYDAITNMTDAVILVYKGLSYAMLNALVNDADVDNNVNFIDVSLTSNFISQVIPQSKFNNTSIKVRANEPLVLLLYSPGGYTPTTLHFGTYDANEVLLHARPLVAANGETKAFFTATSVRQTYMLLPTFKY